MRTTQRRALLRPDTQNRVRAALEQARLRYTTQRATVFACLAELDCHPTAEEVYLAVRRSAAANQPGHGLQSARGPGRSRLDRQTGWRRRSGAVRLPRLRSLSSARYADRRSGRSADAVRSRPVSQARSAAGRKFDPARLSCHRLSAGSAGDVWGRAAGRDAKRRKDIVAPAAGAPVYVTPGGGLPRRWHNLTPCRVGTDRYNAAVFACTFQPKGRPMADKPKPQKTPPPKPSPKVQGQPTGTVNRSDSTRIEKRSKE